MNSHTTIETSGPDLGSPAEVPNRSTWPTFGEDEVQAACDVLRSGKVNALHHGAQNEAFEKAMADLCGVPHAIAVANGTLALELALHALGIGAGDEVIVPARSFMATASCVIACGARPVFADVDRVSQNITASTIEAALTANTKAIIVVHLAGWPCEMADIMELAERRDLRVIEDCAQAHGALIDGQPVGSFGDAAAFSFCTDKIISTAGEGGMMVTRHRDCWKKAWAYKDHGKDPDNYAGIVPGPDFLYLHDSLGSNFRLTEMQAAIGLLQIGKLDDRLAARRSNAAAIEAELAGVPAIRLMQPRDGVEHARYKYYVAIRPEMLRDGWERRHIIENAAAAGLPCSTGSCPEIYLEPAFEGYELAPDQRLPVARELGETTIMLQVDHTLTTDDCRAAGRILKYIVELAMR
ncbi:DegT/DnrJ/EryC1/StrS family aminotransferase [Qipengyuania zhejiangensis]|uniref:DegT/DnrJ/EryC1/StrS family aminotransferase n=1 Tax=Qipengyuania zhejiangensis TaxID=3077782 RepID=UPI002D77F21E|nr:DegT/DnrJ/EryC1/StrS aminotransferase family protein [Qipengyuania sp. Z2]